MIGKITNILTNPSLSNIAQSTTASVSLETGMKAIGRPSFILMDKDIDKSTKNYAAMKELLYQLTCLGVYMALVIPVFKNGAFKIAKKCFKDEKAFNYFQNAKSYLDYLNLSKMGKAERINAINKKGSKLNLSEEIKEYLCTNNTPEKHSIIKGAIELGNIVGCVAGLAIISPQISQFIVHPALKLLGFKKTEQNK